MLHKAVLFLGNFLLGCREDFSRVEELRCLVTIAASRNASAAEVFYLRSYVKQPGMVQIVVVPSLFSSKL